jgi:L-asparaginase/Glu-tRNA(Gln) amidotransferase subunit D
LNEGFSTTETELVSIVRQYKICNDALEARAFLFRSRGEAEKAVALLNTLHAATESLRKQRRQAEEIQGIIGDAMGVKNQADAVIAAIKAVVILNSQHTSTGEWTLREEGAFFSVFHWS